MPPIHPIPLSDSSSYILIYESQHGLKCETFIESSDLMALALTRRFLEDKKGKCLLLHNILTRKTIYKLEHYDITDLSIMAALLSPYIFSLDQIKIFPKDLVERINNLRRYTSVSSQI